MSDAKLRRLLAFCQERYGGHGQLMAMEIGAEVRRLLAEPEPEPEPVLVPATLHPDGRVTAACNAPPGQCVATGSAEGSWCPRGCFAATGRHAWRNALGVLKPEPPRRETIDQEIARLYGQDGRR